MSNTIVSTTPDNSVLDGTVRDWTTEVLTLLKKGAPEDIRKEGEKVAASAGSGLIPWFALAHDIYTARAMEGLAFSEMVGGNGKNYLLRMRNAHVLYTAHTEKGRTLSPVVAMRLGNVLSKKKTDEVAGEVRKGRDPLKTSTGAPVADKVKKEGDDKRESQPATEKARKVIPTTYAETLSLIMGRAGEIPEGDRAVALAAALSIVATLEGLGTVPADLSA